MVKLGQLFLLVGCGIAMGLMALQPVSAATITICVESTEFPPFNYFDRTQSVEPRSVGYDIDVLNLTFKNTPISHQVIALPWKRCLQEVKQGSIDAAMSASLNDQRRRDYLISAPYYYLTPSYFYLKSDFPNGVQITRLNQLTAYGNVCGIQNFNYDNFGQNKSLHIFKIRDLSHLPEMLTKKRCQFFLARKETLSGTLAINDMENFFALLEGIQAPDTQPEPFYMLISKHSPHRDTIKRLFDNKVNSLSQQGRLQALLDNRLKALQQDY